MAVPDVRRFGAELLALTVPLVGVLAVAADSDPDAAAMLRDVQQQRRATAHGLLAMAVGDAGQADRPTSGGDEVYLLTSAPTYVQLVNALRW